MVLLLTGLYILLAGFHIAALALLLSATAGVVIPVVLSGVGILEMLSGIFEAMLDGIMAVFEAIADFFTGLFG
jgi:hypothetical protein